MIDSVQEADFKNCPIRNVLARISGKWSLLILYALHHDAGSPLRFNALRHRIPDISQKVLTSTLRTLEADGLVSRQVYAEVPPRVEYQLTKRALTLLPLIDALVAWASKNMVDIMHDRERRIADPGT